MITKSVEQAQEKVEGANFDLRKHLLEYDDVLNKQRSALYKRRNEMLAMLNKEDISRTIAETAYAHLEASWGFIANAPLTDEELGDPESALRKKIAAAFKEAALIKNESELPAGEAVLEKYRELIDRRSAEIAENPLARNQLLGILDMLWMTNLEDLEALQEAVGLRAYGQHDPLVEYRHEASRLFKAFWSNFNGWVFGNIFKLANGQGQTANSSPMGLPTEAPQSGAKVGRNDPCPCGSGKKWKKCGLMNSGEHQRFMRGEKPKHEVTGG